MFLLPFRVQICDDGPGGPRVVVTPTSWGLLFRSWLCDGCTQSCWRCVTWKSYFSLGSFSSLWSTKRLSESSVMKQLDSAVWWGVKWTPTALQLKKFSLIGHSMGECSFTRGLLVTVIFNTAAVSQLKSFYLQVVTLLQWCVSDLSPVFVFVTWEVVVVRNAYCVSRSLLLCILTWWMFSSFWTALESCQQLQYEPV